MSDTDLTLRELARMWEERDPMPADLVDKVLVAIATDDLDAEYELLHLVERTRELVGTRGAVEVGEAFTVAFSGGEFSLLLRVSESGRNTCRVDGWVTPARPMKVTVSQRNKTYETVVDGLGRFELAKLPTGLTRFWLLAGDTAESEKLFATPTIEL